MESKTNRKEKVARESAALNISDDLEYSDEIVKDYSYYDFVKLHTNARGMLFSFGKMHPEDKVPTIYEEIFLPLDVALSLHHIMSGQFEILKSKNVIRIESEEEKKS